MPWPSTSRASRPHPDAAGSLTRHRGVHRDTVDPDGGWSTEADQVLHPQRVVQRLGMEPRDVRRRADRGDEPGRPAAGTGDALTTVDVRARASPRGTATARPQPLHGSCRRTRDRRRTGHRSASRRVLGRGRPGGRCLRPSRSHACRVDPPDRARPTTSVLVGGALWNVYRRQAAVPGLVAVGDSVATTTPTRGRGIAMAYLQVAALLALLDEGVDPRTVADPFGPWCEHHIEPWVADHRAIDGGTVRRWRGQDLDLTGPLSSDLIAAATEADPRIGPDARRAGRDHPPAGARRLSPGPGEPGRGEPRTGGASHVNPKGCAPGTDAADPRGAGRPSRRPRPARPPPVTRGRRGGAR